MVWEFYVWRDLVIVPTMARTPAGLYLSVEPVEGINRSNIEAVAQAVLSAMKRGNPVVPQPDRDQCPAPVVVSYARVRTWRQFARQATAWAIRQDEAGFTIVAHRRGERDASYEDQARSEKIPAHAGMEAVAHRAAMRATTSDDHQ